MTMASIKLFQLLKPRIGEREADALITYMNTTVNDSNMELREFIQATFVTKEEFKGEMASVRLEIAKVDTKISEVKSDVLRWVFAFFITVMLAILGLYLKK